jgi:hypothetical protein
MTLKIPSPEGDSITPHSPPNGAESVTSIPSEQSIVTSLQEAMDTPLTTFKPINKQLFIPKTWLEGGNYTSNMPMSLVDMDAIDDCDNLEDKREIPKVAGKLAALCRANILFSGYTMANELVAADWLRTEMRSKGFRNKDIVRILPYAIKLCFVPTKHELNARVMTMGEVYQDLHTLSNRQLRRRNWKQFLFSWATGDRGTFEVRASPS